MIQNYYRIETEIFNRVNETTNVVSRYIENQSVRYNINNKDILTLKYTEEPKRWCIELHDLINYKYHFFYSNDMFFTEGDFVIKAYEIIMREVEQHKGKIKESKEEIRKLIDSYSKLLGYDDDSTRVLRVYLFDRIEKEKNLIKEL